MVSLRTSAAYRIAFTYATAFALAMLLLGTAVYFAADAEFRRQRDKAIVEEAVELAREANDPRELRQEIDERARLSSPEGFGIALFDRSGRRVAGTLAAERPPAGLGDIVFHDPKEGPDIARADAIDLPDGSRLVVALDSETIENIDATILALFGVAFVALLLVGGVSALLLGRYLRLRLGTISSTARAIVEGDFAHRVPVSPRGDEFDQVGSALNAMLDRIDQLMENLRQVSSDIAHDLRTPLVRLRNQLELVGSVDDAAEKAIQQGDALLALFAAILRISEVEGGKLAASFEALDLSALAEDVCETFQPAIADSKRALDWAIAPGIRVLGNRELLAQAIGNLLDNARLHTPPGTQIAVTLVARAAAAELTVSDQGPGVPAQDYERMLHRFTRGEASRSTPGAGLGLSLVAAVAKAHGGQVVLADNAPGLRVTLILPVAGG
ncbi:sensor histidine kinase [Sphingomonas pruni]|uniref:sensor histidine kinase n=1 Tax=Sphingomonas pruni TaxID=40683 RepID=UPI0008321BFB|nr:ATP-binding protein [Sphingomonas pruni]